MYTTRAQKFDEENVENWKGGAEGILVFTGLFSSTVASFIAISYQDLRQDPNVTTQSLLAQISQQLSNSTTVSTGGTASIDSTFIPSTSVVFINSVWSISLVLSLTCALIATLLQQWARRYLQIVQRTHAPHVSAHIREYFSQGTNKFKIYWLVEALPSLLLVSVILFFVGLIVFLFLANHTVAYVTLSIVAFCFLSYIILTLLPLFRPDCPYQTPLTTIIWYGAQGIRLLLSYVHHLFSEAESTQTSYKAKVRSILEGINSKFENSAKGPSIDIYRAALSWTLNQFDEERELEDFVSEVPGLRESEALLDSNEIDIRTALAALPGPANFHPAFPWSIIGLARRAITNNLSKPIRQQRIKACLKALYYIPGAIRDVLVPYGVKKYYCLTILPLMNSVESLETIEELWETPRDDVAVAVRCAAAVIAAFMITPPRDMLDRFLAPNVPFIGNNEAGKRFLSKRLRADTSPGANDDVSTDSDLNSDNARLQNLVRFLKDIKDTVRHIGPPGWAPDSTQQIHREGRALSDARKTEKYRSGTGIFEQHGNRTSPAYIPAAQIDLIILTLEILVQDPVTAAALPQREAFGVIYKELTDVVRSSALEKEAEEAQPLAETRGRPDNASVDSVEMVLRTLRPIALSLGLPPLGDPPMVHGAPPPWPWLPPCLRLPLQWLRVLPQRQPGVNAA